MIPVIFKLIHSGPERWYNALLDGEKDRIYLQSCIGRPEFTGFTRGAIDYNYGSIRRLWVVERVVQQVDKKYEDLYT